MVLGSHPHWISWKEVKHLHLEPHSLQVDAGLFHSSIDLWENLYPTADGVLLPPHDQTSPRGHAVLLPGSPSERS